MNINIYYGGRGVLDDPTLYVLNKMQEVLEELHVTVKRYNLYELKNTITTLPQTLKEADGIVLGSTVEWIGIGGYMQQFLDACWLYGNKNKISELYMQPVIMSTTYGEKEGLMTLENAWEMLGGLPCSGVCGYVEDLVSFEMKRDYTVIIEKKAENLYRTISQKVKELPSSNQAVKQAVLRTKQIELTPQESEQLSKYVADDDYVKRQKEDIQELAGLFSEMLKDESGILDEEFIKELKGAFVKGNDTQVTYKFLISNHQEPLILEIDGDECACSYGERDKVDVIAKMESSTLYDIIHGSVTFQRAFMTGVMTAKGNFKTLQMLDKLFNFPSM